jgi:hypothetical protein
MSNVDEFLAWSQKNGGQFNDNVEFLQGDIMGQETLLERD